MRKMMVAVVLVLSACGAAAVPVDTAPASSRPVAGGEITECRKGAVPECTTRTFVYRP